MQFTRDYIQEATRNPVTIFTMYLLIIGAQLWLLALPIANIVMLGKYWGHHPQCNNNRLLDPLTYLLIPFLVFGGILFLSCLIVCFIAGFDSNNSVREAILRLASDETRMFWVRLLIVLPAFIFSITMAVIGLIVSYRDNPTCAPSDLKFFLRGTAITQTVFASIILLAIFFLSIVICLQDTPVNNNDGRGQYQPVGVQEAQEP